VKPLRLIASLFVAVLCAIMVAGPAAMFVGCAAPSAARVAHNSIKASDAAVEGAIRAWGVSFASREDANEQTRTSDPSGYLDRRHELTKEYGRVVELHGRYSDAVRATVEAWVAAKQAGLPAPIEPPTTPEIDTLRAQLQAISK